MEEHQGGDVAGQAEQLGHRHKPVPGLDRQGHHEQLGEDQRREGDGHDVHEFGLEQQQRPVHDGAPWARGESPGRERPVSPTRPPMPGADPPARPPPHAHALTPVTFTLASSL